MLKVVVAIQNTSKFSIAKNRGYMGPVHRLERSDCNCLYGSSNVTNLFPRPMPYYLLLFRATVLNNL
jgi:hypothetical protein